jgi:hypothetical protein
MTVTFQSDNGALSPQKRFTGRSASLLEYAYVHCYTRPDNGGAPAPSRAAVYLVRSASAVWRPVLGRPKGDYAR